MSLQHVPWLSFDFVPSRPVEIEISTAPLTSDAGLLPLRQFDEQIRLTEQVAAALDGRRDRSLTRQSHRSMVRPRVDGILADDEGQNDHDTLRSDPAFELIADRLPDGPGLASQPTLSRFEDAVSSPDLRRLRDVLVDLFLQAFDTPPHHLTLDIDAFDDAAHGQQQRIMSHGCYQPYQYLPIVITCAEDDPGLLVGLRHGTCHAPRGADDDLRHRRGRPRAAWPDVHVHVRGDSGLGVPTMDDARRELRPTYTFGIGMNSTLRERSDAPLAGAVAEYERTGRPQRSSLPVDSRAANGPAPQPVVIEVAAHAQGTHRRAVVTNRPGCAVPPQAVYDADAMRGEGENRNEELKSERAADRLSDHRSLANSFRPYLHAAALDLRVRLRHAVVRPAPTSAELGRPAELPAAALDEPARKRPVNKRRERDPPGEGFACTWRTRLIKVAAERITRARRVRVRLSGCWPPRDPFLQVSPVVISPPRPPPSGRRPASRPPTPPTPTTTPRHRGGGRSVLSVR